MNISTFTLKYPCRSTFFRSGFLVASILFAVFFLFSSISATAQIVDAGVTNLIFPGPGTPATNGSVMISFRNYGSAPITTTQVQYTLNGGAPVIETWNGNLLPNANAIYTFSATVNASDSTAHLCAKTLLPGDINPSNDQSCPAQPIFFNNGAMVYVNTLTNTPYTTTADTLVYINGTLQNHDSIIENLGSVAVRGGNVINNAQLGLSSSLGNNGIFYVSGDWINNGTFYSGTGKVKLDGNAHQYIEGDSVTSFYNLELENNQTPSSIKTQTINSFVTGTLDIHECELATDNDTMFVTNTNTSAIVRDPFDPGGSGIGLGIVSSWANGNLSWKTLDNAMYDFPVGSSVDSNGFHSSGAIFRYRPVAIRPATNAPNTFSVRMVNKDASLDGYNNHIPGVDYDSTICYENQLYYHRINHTAGIDSANVSLNYDTTDGEYNGMAQWKTVPVKWNSLGITNNSQIIQPFLGVTKQNWTDFSTDPFILVYYKPKAPFVDGADSICAKLTATYTAPPASNGGTFHWNVTGGGIILTDTNTVPPPTSITILWPIPGNGTVMVSQTDPNGCKSYPDDYNVYVRSLAHAKFKIDTLPNSTLPGGLFTNDLIAFVDSSVNTSLWNWSFGDGVSSTDENPYHTYSNIGDYAVTLIATSHDGCTDTLTKNLKVVEGLVIPNIFTPNGDGINDVVNIRSSGVGEFTMKIYNRWGTLVFETTAPELHWDGRTFAGEIASAGTYFYTVEAKFASGDDIHSNLTGPKSIPKGTITLIR